jgi:Secretion system C-terminal sorting domain/Abnormal spindle-like microcephaly-assoc'd, ASPM-SPD-2-Hydin/PQQ-like domain
MLGFYIQANSQTIVGVYPFQYSNTYNYLWGITQINDTLWVGSGYTGTGYTTSKMYKVTKPGVVVDSLTTPFKFNHGLAWDGTGFWIAEDYRTAGGRIYKINMAGTIVDSIYTNTNLQGIGGIALDGNNLWVASYYPDNATYPNAYAYKINLTSKLVVDTIPLRGRQVQGITVKGDTIFYVNTKFQGEQEKIYAYRKVVGDTLFSFPAPDVDNDCDPRGLYWDGQYLWLMAYRIGNNISAYRSLYKYQIGGTGNPQITVNSSLFDFGNVPVGTTSNQTLNISNTGAAKLIISGKTISNPRFGITPNNVPDTIQPGQNKNYTVSFNPLAYDTLSAQLQIASNDILVPLKVITLRGKGVYNGATIGLSATSFDYQQRRVNSLCGYQFTVTNQGNANLNISSVLFNTARYRLDTVGVTFPYTILPEASKTFRVWFNPNAGGIFSDTLKINSNATNLPVARLSLTGSGNTNPTTLGTQLWTASTPDNPFTSVDDFQPTSIKMINDVNADGVNDIIVCSGNYYTACWNGNSSINGDLLWIFNTGYDNNNTGSVSWEDGMVIRDDVDGDGIQDVVFGCAGGNEMVYTLSGRTGRQIWAYGDSISYSDGDIEGVRADKDYNGDGVKDVLISASGTGTGTGGRHAVICVNGLNGNVIFNITQSSEFTGDVVTTPYGGAIGWGSNAGTYSFHGFDNNGNNNWTFSNINGKIWSSKLIPTINLDTAKEILGYYGFAGKVFCIGADNGVENWNVTLGSANAGFLKVLDDLDSNGSPDFTLSGPQTVYRIDTKTHNTLWQYSPGASYIRGVDMLSDVNGDGKKDVVVAMQTPGNVIVLNGATGTAMFTYSFGSTVSFRADRVCALNSLDGNSTTEFIAGCRDGRLICFSGGQNVPIGINVISTEVPNKFELSQNYPNPFNPVTNIRFAVPNNEFVSIKVYDVLGKEVSTLLNENKQTGTYEVSFNASSLSSGVYFYKMTAGKFSSIKRMVVLK